MCTSDRVKQCSMCKRILLFDRFNAKTERKDGKRSECKECQAAKSKVYIENNKEKIAESGKRYYQANKEHVCERTRNNHKKNIERGKALRKIRYEANKKRYSATSMAWAKHKRVTDPMFKLMHGVRTIILKSLTYYNHHKQSKTTQLVGCPIEQLFQHPVDSFIVRYNRFPRVDEKIHLDHIWPFNIAETETEINELCHWTNMQWLTAEDNMKKGCKLDWQTQYYPEIDAMLAHSFPTV